MLSTLCLGIVPRTAFVLSRAAKSFSLAGLLASTVVTGAVAQTTPPAPTSPPVPAAPTETGAQTETPTEREVIALRAELVAARARIAELEAELAALKASMPATVPNGPSTAPKGTPPTEPTEAERRIASVGDFLAKAKAQYAAAFPPPAEGQPAETAATRQRALERFVSSMNRNWRQAVEWNVRVVKSERVGEGVVLTVQQLDEQGADLGEPIPVSIEARRVRRLEAAYVKAQPNDPFFLRAEFTPALVVDNNRLEPGVFNNPPLIGPAVELRYELSAEALAPIRQRGEKANTKPNEKSGGGPTR